MPAGWVPPNRVPGCCNAIGCGQFADYRIGISLACGCGVRERERLLCDEHKDVHFTDGGFHCSECPEGRGVVTRLATEPLVGGLA